MSFIAKIFSSIFGGDASEPTPPPPVPKKDDAAVQEAAARERELNRKRAGRSSTVLTSQQGDTSEAKVGKTVLGG